MTEKKSTKSQSNDSNITPVRSEAMLNKPRGNIGGGSRLLIFFLGFINLIGLFILGLWFFNTSYYQQQTGQGFVERISFLEENNLKPLQFSYNKVKFSRLHYRLSRSSIINLISVAPESIEFSINSLTIEDGFSITSPAAI